MKATSQFIFFALILSKLYKMEGEMVMASMWLLGCAFVLGWQVWNLIKDFRDFVERKRFESNDGSGE